MPGRNKVLSRLTWIKESTWATDPGSPVKRVVPLADEEGFKNSQPRNPARIFDGIRAEKGSFKGMIDASGDIPVSMDFRFLGRVLDDFFGHSVYIRVGSLHRWVGHGSPNSFQLQKEFPETTAIYHRHRGIYAGTVRFDTQMSGQNRYVVGSTLGKGDEQLTDVGGTVTNDGPFSAVNYFDGAIFKDGVSLATVTAWNFMLDNKLAGKDAAFQAGQRAAVGFGMPESSGDLGMIFSTEDGDTFYNQAILDTPVSLSCLYTNKPLASNPTMWAQFYFDRVLFSRAEPAAGGEGIADHMQHWVAEVPLFDHQATAIGTNVQTFAITGSNNVAKFFIDGAGSSVGATLTTGATRTAAQIIAELNLNGGFAAAAIADDFNGRVRVRSLSTVAATSKVQSDTAVSNSSATVLGFDTTIWSGYAAAGVYAELKNDISADY